MNEIRFKVIRFKENQGHGKARNASILNTSNEFVAIMDADDISIPTRFERELDIHLERHISVVGGQITEFIKEPNNIIGIRAVPETNKEIYRYLKKRCPINQMTVMFRKSEVFAAGGYQDWYCNEDYYLWIRMAEKRMIFENIPDILVNARVGDAMCKRRGGWKYFRSEQKLQKYMLDKKCISIFRYFYNVVIRFLAEVVVSDSLRSKLFRLTRKTYSKDKKKKTIETNKTITKTYPPFSVAMSVYKNDNAEWFETALNSIIEQTVKPSEIVIVVDGPIPNSINDVIDKYTGLYT